MVPPTPANYNFHFTTMISDKTIKIYKTENLTYGLFYLYSAKINELFDLLKTRDKKCVRYDYIFFSTSYNSSEI